VIVDVVRTSRTRFAPKAQRSFKAWADAPGFVDAENEIALKAAIHFWAPVRLMIALNGLALSALCLTPIDFLGRCPRLT
jgi:hypothetical protein